MVFLRMFFYILDELSLTKSVARNESILFCVAIYLQIAALTCSGGAEE
jgi:hypothetical protein